MFAKLYSAQPTLLDADIVSVEVDISKGLHAFNIVGLPDKAVEESRDRISAAIKNSGFISPKSKNQKIVISLAPADIKKEGPAFDLSMALVYMLAANDVLFNPEEKLFLGELSLDGELRSIRGVLPIVKKAKMAGFTDIFVPYANREEAALISDINVFAVRTLKEILDHLDPKRADHKPLIPQPKTDITYERPEHAIGFGDIKGQLSAKRALQIAAAGGHNIVLYGPPGTGKTLLARAFTNILPQLSFNEVLETTAIHSVAGTLGETLITHPPFRSPHHTASYVSIVGGGAVPKPGEVTLAHRGVLFLDEFPEFERRVIDSLRGPLEDREVHISRVKGAAHFPANFILVATMNPCPCGNFGSDKICTCSPSHLLRYQKKISGPIVDRIDMWIEVPHVDIKTLSERHRDDSETERVREEVKVAREKQTKRFEKPMTNSAMNVRDLERAVVLREDVQETLNGAVKALDLSPRAYHKVIKLARTIADLDGKEEVEEPHILEALQYRPKQPAL